MDQVVKMAGATGGTYSLPLARLSSDFPPLMRPAPETDWQPLPDILDGITFASRFVGDSRIWGPWRDHLDHVHVARGNVFATDASCLVEYHVGECPDFSFLPVRVAQIKAFGEAPSHVCLDNHLKLKWSNGNILISRFRRYPKIIDQMTRLFAEHDWNGFVKMDPDWRDQILGRFSYKPAPSTKATSTNQGFIHFAPDRIVGGPYDDDPTVQLRIVTHARANVTFRQTHLLRALKIADEFKFAHGDEASHFLFKTPKVRGMIALNRPVNSIPVLS